jgi:hypothetical protein
LDALDLVSGPVDIFLKNLGGNNMADKNQKPKAEEKKKPKEDKVKKEKKKYT